MAGLFSHILELTFIFFRGVGQPPTSMSMDWSISAQETLICCKNNRHVLRTPMLWNWLTRAPKIRTLVDLTFLDDLPTKDSDILFSLIKDIRVMHAGYM